MIGLAEKDAPRSASSRRPTADASSREDPASRRSRSREDGSQNAIARRDATHVKDARAVVSRSRTTQATLDALARMGITHIEKLGSAGLKVAAVACGEADIWIQTGGAGMLWDACGPEAIALGARVRYAQHDGASPDYTRGPLELRGLVVAATDALRDAALAALR